MCKEATVKNTLAFVFPENAAQPTLADMAGFIKALSGDLSTMETTYKISDEKSVFIRFRSEDAMKFCFENNPETIPFYYTSGEKVMVHMSIAGGNIRYVRIFDLPPEVSDQHLTSVLAKYGKVKRTVRERFPVEFQLDMFTGVRGVYMDIEQDIPEVLYFHYRKGRIFYDGRKLRCFVCRSDTHLKKVCPTIQVRRNEQQANKQITTAQHEHEEEENATAGEDDKTNNWVVQLNSNKKSKKKKRQSSVVSKNQLPVKGNTVNPSTKASVSSESTVSDSLLVKKRIRVPKYEWIVNVHERQQLIDDDKFSLPALFRQPIIQHPCQSRGSALRQWNHID